MKSFSLLSEDAHDKAYYILSIKESTV